MFEGATLMGIDMKSCIAERHLIAKSKTDGSNKDVVVRIGTPYWVVDGEVGGCPVEYSGLLETYADRKGIDLLQALQIAADVNSVLEAMSDEFDFFWPSGEAYEFS